MAKKTRILVVGSINMDLVLNVRKLPASGENTISDVYRYSAGGKGANQATAAALLGAEACFVGKIGKDDNGLRLRNELTSRGVCARWLVCDENETTGLAVILVEEGGKNRIIVYPSANMRLTRRDVLPALNGFHPDALVIQFEIPEQTVIDCRAEAKARGIPVIVDAGPAMAFPIEQIKETLILSPNETETLALCGILPDTEGNAARAARALWERSRAKFIIIKRGEKGAYLYDGSGVGTNVAAVPVAALDPTAAGDAFTAAVTVRYLQTGDILSSVCYANFVGALTVRKPGAQASLPTADEVAAFMAERNER